MEYPKIHTLYHRDKDTFVVTPPEFTHKEFDLVNHWLITEKIDGTNIRVIYTPIGLFNNDNPLIEIKGRTDTARIPSFLYDTLTSYFTEDKFGQFSNNRRVTLFGEGYGYKINKFGKYFTTNHFRLFDVFVEAVIHGIPFNGLWLNWSNICEIAKNMDIETVPVIEEKYNFKEWCKDGERPYYEDILQLCMTSQVVKEDGYTDTLPFSEGVVARTEPLLLTRRGARVMWKLKVKDFFVKGKEKHE